MSIDSRKLAVLQDTRARYALHPKILLTGYSRGGQFAHRFALLNPGLVEACAPLAAGSWTTPYGRFLLPGIGEVLDPETFLSTPENDEGLSASQENFFDAQAAKVAGFPAEPGTKAVPFLVMCGTMDDRFEVAQDFARILKTQGYTVETAWPNTGHGVKSASEPAESLRYAQETVSFFLGITETRASSDSI